MSPSITHPGTKFFSIYRLVKLEDLIQNAMVRQVRDRRSHSKREKREVIKESSVPSKLRRQQNKFHLVSRSENYPLWLGAALSGPTAPQASAPTPPASTSVFVALSPESFFLFLEGQHILITE